MENLQNKLIQKYDRIKQSGLDCLYIHPENVYRVIDTLDKSHSKNHSQFQIAKIGRSFLEKPIYKITLGSGPINLLLWSQMHGDESAATASLFDLINYTLSNENKAWFDSWSNKLTLHIVPVLNPDGAENEQRVNAQGIDINRDAKALQSPEGRLLLSLAEQIKPQFGFNLHSQNRYYTTGDSGKSAVISLLAPPYNDKNHTNESRLKAKQIVSIINKNIQQQYPEQVGRYDDTYSPRSFGDLFSAKGISTILIESGYYKDDKHRQIPRWLTFLGLIESINAIKDQTYVDEILDDYDAIPFNREDGQVDLLLRGLTINDDYQVDISINYDHYFKNGLIDSIGDLSTITGMQNIDMQPYKIHPINGYKLTKPLSLSTEKYIELLKNGYAYFEGDETLLRNDTHWPVIFKPKSSSNKGRFDQTPFNSMKLNQRANFIFSKNDKISLAILNGIVVELNSDDRV